MTNKSTHKNFISWYDEDRDLFVDNMVLPYKDKIFLVLSKKIDKDAKKDELSGKTQIAWLWSDAANSAKNIHDLFKNIAESNHNPQQLQKISENIIDMDYGTVSNIFCIISTKLELLWNLEGSRMANNMKNNFELMRKKSKNHTIIFHV